MHRQIVEIIFDGIRALGRNRELFIIVCKKWLVEKMRPNAKMPLLEDIFSEDVKELPERGKFIQSSEKSAPSSRFGADAFEIAALYQKSFEERNWQYRRSKAGVCL